MTAAARLTLPPGTRLLHIGPPKTGTSTLQGAAHRSRTAMQAQGVRYAGSARHSGAAVLAVMGRRSFGKDEGAPPIRKWQGLLRDVQRAGDGRVLISSEFFADAEPAAIARILDDLDRSRVHVVVTLRPLDRIMPSQWQQYVQSGFRMAWPSWLERMLGNPPDPSPSPSFWRRHRHDELVRRWADEIAPQNVTLVVIDETRPDYVLRVFESLLGLREETLAADEATLNRSMTVPEIEAVRAFNTAFFAAGLGNALFHRAMHFGAASYMRTRKPAPEEPRIELPGSAVARVAEISREMIDGLRDSGVRVIGDLDDLIVRAPGTLPSEKPDDGCIPAEVAATTATGIALAAGLGRGVAPVDTREELHRYPTYQLFGAILGRLRQVPGRWLDAFLRAPSGIRLSAEPSEPTAPANAALAEALGARFTADGLSTARSMQVRDRAIALAASGGAPEPYGCVPPEQAARLALGVLEASGIVRRVGGDANQPRLRRVLWSWLEPPGLASIPSRRIALAIGGRLVGRT